MQQRVLFIKSQLNSQWEGMWINALKRRSFLVDEAWIFENYSYIVKRLGTLASWLGHSKPGMFLFEKYKTILNKSVIGKLDGSYDFIFVYNGWMEFTTHTWKTLKARSGKIVSLLGDNPFIYTDTRFNLHDYLEFVDAFITSDRYAKFLFDFYGEEKAVLVPAGTDNAIFHPHQPSDAETDRFGCQVLFVGTGYGSTPLGFNRAELVNACTGFDLKVFGTRGWKHLFAYFPGLQERVIPRNLTVQELNAAYNSAKIVLALSNPLAVDGSHVRIFDIMASGAFPLVEHRDYVRSLFPRDALVTFRNTGDLKDKIAYFLKNEEERKQIAHAAHDYVVRNYLVDQVLGQVMDKIL